MTTSSGSVSTRQLTIALPGDEHDASAPVTPVSSTAAATTELPDSPPASPVAAATGTMTTSAEGSATITRNVVTLSGTAKKAAGGVAVIGGTTAAVGGILLLAGVITSMACPIILIAAGVFTLAFLAYLAVDYFMNREVTPAPLALALDLSEPGVSVENSVRSSSLGSVQMIPQGLESTDEGSASDIAMIATDAPAAPALAVGPVAVATLAPVAVKASIEALEEKAQAKLPKSTNFAAGKAIQALEALETTHKMGQNTAVAKELVKVQLAKLRASYVIDVVDHGRAYANQQIMSAMPEGKLEISYNTPKNNDTSFKLFDLMMNGSNDTIKDIGTGINGDKQLDVSIARDIVKKFVQCAKSYTLELALEIMAKDIKTAGVGANVVAKIAKAKISMKTLVESAAKHIFANLTDLNEQALLLGNQLVKAGVLDRTTNVTFFNQVVAMVTVSIDAKAKAEEAAEKARKAIEAAQKAAEKVALEKEEAMRVAAAVGTANIMLSGLLGPRSEIKATILAELDAMIEARQALVVAASKVKPVGKTYAEFVSGANGTIEEMEVQAKADFDAAKTAVDNLLGELQGVQAAIDAQELILKANKVVVPVDANDVAHTSAIRLKNLQIDRLEKEVIALKAPSMGARAKNFAASLVPSMPSMPSFGSFFRAAQTKVAVEVDGANPMAAALPSPSVGGMKVAAPVNEEGELVV